MYGEDEVRRPVVLQPPDMGDAWGGSRLTNFDIDGSSARNRFREFFRNFRLENVYIYRDALIRNWNRKELFVEVDLFHLNQFDEVLFNNLQTRPNEIMSFFEAGAKDALKMSLTVENREVLNQAAVADFQIVLRSNQNTQSLRTLTAEHANTLIKVPGIIITSSKTRPKATVICIRCTKCQCVKVRVQYLTVRDLLLAASAVRCTLRHFLMSFSPSLSLSYLFY
jgi:DNA replication licensing factor MCM5